MGFLELGTPLSWSESQKVINYIKDHGLRQFLHIWKINNNRNDRILCWGEELEYSLVTVDEESKSSQVYVGASTLIEELKVREHIQAKGASTHLSSEWHPEFSNHMIEALPSPPYLLNLNSLLIIEPSMRLRRAKIQSVLPKGRYVSSLTTFPRLGMKNYMDSSGLNQWVENVSEDVCDDKPPRYASDQNVTKSIFIKDDLFNPHPRFPTLVASLCSRRKAKQVIKIPIYKDKYTGQSRSLQQDSETNDVALGKHKNSYLVEDDWTLAQDISTLDRFSIEKLSEKTVNPIKDYIYMDCMGFGMSMSCVQSTFACPNSEVAGYLYDQFVVLAPIFLTLSASTPFHRGLLSDYDTRWSALEQSVDCRTEAEETGNKLKDHSTAEATPMKHIKKSRYSSVSLYIANTSLLKRNEDFLNDTNAPLNQAAYDFLRSEGIDHFLAQHYAHMWIRDPLVIFHERTYLDDTKAVDHFENIQSTNWNSVRFKPPPQIGRIPSPIPWRVEFRSPDIQMTDFDNAANVALITILTQALLHYRPSLYIPMSKNDINMKRSWQKDAITDEKFYFRTKIFIEDDEDLKDNIHELSIHEILTGVPSLNFIGLIPLCEKYISEVLYKEASTRQGSLDTKISNLKSSMIVDSDTNFNCPSAMPSVSTTCMDNMPNRSVSVSTDNICTEHNTSIKHEESIGSSTANNHVITDLTCYPEMFGKQVRSWFTIYSQLHIDRATGKTMTCAKFLREFIMSHPLYRQDSIINPSICYDLTVLSILLGFGMYSSIDLHGEIIARHLIQQTPLPADLTLPSLSPEALKLIYCIYEKNLDITRPLIDENLVKRKFVFIKKRMIALNEINSIYTMPLGVTARTGNLEKIGYGADETLALQLNESTRDLTLLTMELFDIQSNALNKKSGTCHPISNNMIPSVVSSEEFTQAWILKGIDCVGGSNNLESDYCTEGSYSCYNKTHEDRCKKNEVCTERASTKCPSACDDFWGEDINDRMHEISRSFNLGFKDEQELEYFQQVCQASG